jgi:hypothetical protein
VGVLGSNKHKPGSWLIWYSTPVDLCSVNPSKVTALFSFFGNLLVQFRQQLVVLT